MEDKHEEPNKLKWSSDHLEWFFNELQDFIQSLEIAKHGMAMTRGVPQAINALDNYYRYLESTKKMSTENQRLKAENVAQKALTEVGNDFPFLNRYAVIYLWALLETSIQLFIKNVIKYDKERTNIEQINNLKIAYREYNELDESERIEYIYELYEKTCSAGIPNGPKKFKKLLEPIGIQIEVDQETSRNLYEMAQLRNVIMHKSCLVDLHLVNHCPWLGYDVGNKLKITTKDIEKYIKSIYKISAIIWSQIAIVYMGESNGNAFIKEHLSSLLK